MKNKAVLELGVEDLPPSMVKSTLEQIQILSKSFLENYKIEFENIQTKGTSQRIVLLIEGVSQKQKDTVEKEIGPPRNVVYDEKGNLTPSGKRYLEAKKAREEDLGIERLEKGEYVYIKRKKEGERTIDILPFIFKDLIKGIHFTKSMRWGKGKLFFGRPLRYIFSLLGENLVEFEIDGIKSGRKIKGHRFLYPEWIEVHEAERYPEIIRKAKVILDPEERKKIIRRDILKAVSEIKKRGYSRAQLVKDENLLEELTYLVEHPIVFWGEFDEKFLSLPSFVLEACLREYQKQFAVSDGEKTLPFFIGIRDGGRHNLREIIEANRRVINARLNDAQFFYQEDLKTPLEKKVPALEGVIFQEKLGSYLDKTKRLIKLVEKISFELKADKNLTKRVKRAAYLCKADILTNMGKEFPQLQGTLGKEYALFSGEDPIVAQAIEEHRKPCFAGDSLPKSLEGAILAIADKIDTLSGAFWVGFIPSGSQDPWGLRREAQGVIEIIIERKVDINLEKILQESINLYGEDGENTENAKERLKGFLEQRLTNFLREKGLTHEQIKAVMVKKENLVDLFERACALKYITSRKEFKKEALAIIRILNILKQAKRWGISVTSGVKEERLKEKEEKNLYSQWKNIKETIDMLLSRREYEKAYKELSTLKETIHLFFDKVLVMSEDKEERLNRLCLLQEIGSRFLKIADFTRLNVK